VDAKDKYTHFHSRNVTAYTLALADGLGVTGEERNDLWNAALLHDIGKIGIPESILNKPGKLTNEEYDIIKTHPVKGCSILAPIKAFKNLLPAIRHHHERYDGRGYPDGLVGRHIPMAARFLTVADSFDAMTSSRVYRESPGEEFALKQLDEYSGTQFDPNLAKAFIEIVKARPHGDILTAYGSDLAEDHPILHD
jgi:putative nucleotidyltransferase with HDIG domain